MTGFRGLVEPVRPYLVYVGDLSRAMKFWADKAACRKLSPTVMFPTKHNKQVQVVAKICVNCPVKAQCLELALATFTEDGVWGGATEAELKTLVDFIRSRTDLKGHWSNEDMALVARTARGFVAKKRIKY